MGPKSEIGCAVWARHHYLFYEYVSNVRWLYVKRAPVIYQTCAGYVMAEPGLFVLYTMYDSL
jgi:hypothetical protein